MHSECLVPKKKTTRWCDLVSLWTKMTPPEVIMIHIEEIQLFFLAHPDGDRRYTNVQMIRQAVKNL